MFVNDHSETKQQGLANFVNVCWLLLTLLLAPVIQYSVFMVSLWMANFGVHATFFQSKGSVFNCHNEDCMRAAKFMVQKIWLLSILFSHTALSTTFFTLRSCLKQHWVYKMSMKEHRKAFVGPSQAGQSMHWRQRSASLWLKELHLPLTVAKSVNREAFVAPGNFC